MNLAEYTSSAYEVTLTSSSNINTTSLEPSSSGDFTYTSTASASGTFWNMSLVDSKSFSSESEIVTASERTIFAKTDSMIKTYATSSSSSTTSTAYKGSTYQLDSYISTNTLRLESLRFDQTGLNTTVSVSVYADFTTFYTSYSNKGRQDTFISVTVNSTNLVSGTSNVVSLSRTERFNETTTSESSVSNTQFNMYNGVVSSLIYTEAGTTFKLGDKVFNESTSSSSQLLMTKKSLTVYNDSKSISWGTTSTATTNIPATSMTYSGVETTEGVTFSNGSDQKYTTSYSYTSSVNSSSVSYRSISVYPQVLTASIKSSTASFIDEIVDSWGSHVRKNNYLYSLTLTITTIATRSASLTDSHSFSSTYTKYFENRGVHEENQYISDYESYSPHREDTTKESVEGFFMDAKTLTLEGYATWVGYSSFPVYSSWNEWWTSWYSSITSRTTTTWWTTSFSSTLYSGTFDTDHKSVTTTLSNYASVVNEKQEVEEIVKKDSGPTGEIDGQMLYTYHTHTREEDRYRGTVWTNTRYPIV